LKTQSQTTAADFVADLQTRGCPVCNHVIKIARDFFAQWQYAISSSENTRAGFAEELGFCPVHSWQLHEMSSPLGESTGLQDFVQRISRMLAQMNGQPNASAAVKAMMRNTDTCRVCGMLRETEAMYLTQLAAFIVDLSGKKNYNSSPGVCLRHLSHLLAVTSEDDGRFLLSVASRQFHELAKQMRSYVKKRDAVRRDLIGADEEDAYLRALIHLVGAKDYFAP
jgi:hypothetical protein